MMIGVKIDEIDKLVGSKVVKYTTSNLTAPGENYCSTIFALEIELENGDVIHAIGKMLPPTEFLRMALNVSHTFKIELGFYKTIIPVYKKFHDDFSKDPQPFDFFPKLLGGRYNVENDDDKEIDDHACILLENLKTIGFQTVKRTEGFNYETLTLVLKNLAKFHGTGIALKMKNPQIFKEKIKPYLKEYKLFMFEVLIDIFEKTKKDMEQMVQDKELIPKLNEIFDESVDLLKHPPKNNEVYKDEPWSTLIHVDIWSNNIMIKFVDGRPVENKFVDFQIYEYGSPARDLMYLLFTSTHEDVLPRFDDLIEYYHNNLIATLKGYDCDIAEFGYELFLGTLAKWVKKLEMTRSLVMLNTLFVDKDSAIDVTKLGPDALKEMAEGMELNKKHLDRGTFIIKKCVERSWI